VVENKSSYSDAEVVSDIPVEIKTSLPTVDNIKDKNPFISSAARKSSFINLTSEKEPYATQISKKQAVNVKSMGQARRPSTDGRPFNINIPIIPVPTIAKPNRMNMPTRRFSLPVGKS